MQNSLMKSRYLLSILTAILIGTSYIPFPPWAIFFCLTPLWSVWLKASSAKEIFWLGWVAQFGSTLIGFNWVSYTVHEFGHLPWVASLALLLAFSSICTLSIPLAGVAWHWYCRTFNLREGARIAALPVFCALGQRLTPQIFDWHFGYTWLWAGFPAAQFADVIGFVGFSDLGFAFNAAILYAWVRRQRQMLWWPWIAAPLALFAALNVYGLWRRQNLPKPDAMARFLLVQANIGNEEKLMAEAGSHFREVVIDKFYQLTLQGVRENAATGIDFAVWPETAFPEFIDEPQLLGRYPFMLRQLVTGLHTKLITGAYSHVPDGRATNSFFVLDEKGTWTDKPYHKTMLLAFGEYFPGAAFFPKVREWFPEVADFARGPGPSVLQAGEQRLGAQVCYEGLFDWFTRGLANNGAQILVNVTNDSWYGTWQEPWQHLYMTLARALEVRRPLVRSTNTGISAVIYADGTIPPLSPVHQAWQHAYEVPYLKNPPATPFMGWGYWLLPTLLGLTLVGLPFKYRA